VPHVLVVEDDPAIRSALIRSLGERGHAVSSAADALSGLRQAIDGRPDIVLLDLGLPDLDGTELLRMLRAVSSVPVIVATARDDDASTVRALDVGADDYVVKPFSVRELLLRIQAVLRRGAEHPVEEPPGRVEFGCLTFDRAAHRAWVDTVEVELTALEFKLLVTLYDRRDRVQSRATLLDDVWGITADITTRTVDTHVKRLREKLAAARDYIETVRGVGYRFVAAPLENAS
jgi:two-component system phosphate regulon response regulator PhoB